MNNMRILTVGTEPIHLIPYLRAGTGGRAETAQLPIYGGRVDSLPPGLDAIVCTGDLQGVELLVRNGTAPRLLGEVLAEELAVLLELQGVSPQRTGIVLSGDFYSSPGADQRGASGDVRSVWNAFHQRFRWVAGVLGNHDQLGSSVTEFKEFLERPNFYCLDGTCQVVDRLKVAGVGGIIGKASKPLRRSAKEYLGLLKGIQRVHPDVVVLHQSPAISSLGYVGSEELGTLYEQQSFGVTVCGHVSWPSAFVELSNGNQLLNVDSRVVILKCDSA